MKVLRWLAPFAGLLYPLAIGSVLGYVIAELVRALP